MMNHHDMSLDIDLLRTFAAVADTASFTVAGLQVGATHRP